MLTVIGIPEIGLLTKDIPGMCLVNKRFSRNRFCWLIGHVDKRYSRNMS